MDASVHHIVMRNIYHVQNSRQKQFQNRRTTFPSNLWKGINEKSWLFQWCFLGKSIQSIHKQITWIFSPPRILRIHITLHQGIIALKKIKKAHHCILMMKPSLCDVLLFFLYFRAINIKFSLFISRDLFSRHLFNVLSVYFWCDIKPLFSCLI